MSELSQLERYKPLVDDWAAFEACSLAPLPTCIWTNTLRTSGPILAELLAADGIEVRPLSWSANSFRLPDSVKPGTLWQFLAGLYHVQEEVSMLPIAFLDPQPGERILDLCAAPGNKTAQIGVAMANQGTVVGNDQNYSRMRALRQTSDRLGLLNLTTTLYDATKYPTKAGLFDKVLVDAPCSCEGTSRKNPKILKRIGPKRAIKMSHIQKAILSRAVRLCKPGGRIIYSTCTYAPEENEMVVEAILRKYGRDTLQLLPARLDNFKTSPGLTRWEDEEFDPDMINAMRVWPHQNDSGGFFIAVLEKRGDGLANPEMASNSCQAFGEPISPELALDPVQARFDIPADAFEPYAFFRRNAESYHMATKTHQPPRQPVPTAVGMAFIRTKLKHPKMTTGAAMKFGPQARQNIVPLRRNQVEAYLERKEFLVTANQVESCTGFGYVLPSYAGFTLGVALYLPHRGKRGGGRLQSMFPKAWSYIDFG